MHSESLYVRPGKEKKNSSVFSSVSNARSPIKKFVHLVSRYEKQNSFTFLVYFATRDVDKYTTDDEDEQKNPDHNGKWNSRLVGFPGRKGFSFTYKKGKMG